MKKLMISVVVFVAFFLVSTLAFGQEAPVLLKAMQDELARSVDKLKLENEEAPYFISYLIKDCQMLEIVANSGAVTRNDENRFRKLDVDVRVGNYDLDNSHFQSFQNMGFSMRMFGGRAEVTLEDNYDVLRRELWLETDRAYKDALETFTKKKAYLQNTIRSDSLPDFTREEKLSNMKLPAAFDAKRDLLSRTVGDISRLFLGNDKIQKSTVALKRSIENTYYVNSEGAVYVEPHVASRLSISATAQAEDGMPLKDFLVYAFADVDGMPAVETLKKDVEAMMRELAALRNAPVAEDYSGPVLFAGQAAAEILAQGFVDNLVAERTSASDNAQFNMFSGKRENPFLSKAELPVTAKSISVKAQPTLKNYGGAALLGSYEVDDEGVRTQDVSLIENGILKNFMMSRSPVKGFNKSNGHFRGTSAAPSVVRLSSSEASPYGALKDRLIQEVKDDGLKYGYIIKSIIPLSEAKELGDIDIQSMVMSMYTSSPTEIKLSRPVVVYRVYPDGKEELVRGAEFANLGIKCFKDIIGTSDDAFVYNYPIRSSEMPFDLGIFGISVPGSDYYASVITPAIIISEIDVNKSIGNYGKPPIVSYPSLVGK
ncbi:MAG: metallopeptidase TldD-related protein [Candidatus Eisenbacteria bacterium]|nr:metallopeptidase TldD-related protein [Candidatus Eisenbacteria bacterium]